MSYHERYHALIRVELLRNIPVDRFKLYWGYPSKSHHAENEEGYKFSQKHLLVVNKYVIRRRNNTI